MRSPTHRAARAEQLSKEALTAWAASRRFHAIFLDGPSGKPRTGIVDVLLVRHRRDSADAFEIYAVQLKGGGAGMTPREMSRLQRSASSIRAEPLVVLHDEEMLHFLPKEPERRRSRAS